MFILYRVYILYICTWPYNAVSCLSTMCVWSVWHIGSTYDNENNILIICLLYTWSTFCTFVHDCTMLSAVCLPCVECMVHNTYGNENIHIICLLYILYICTWQYSSLYCLCCRGCTFCTIVCNRTMLSAVCLQYMYGTGLCLIMRIFIYNLYKGYILNHHTVQYNQSTVCVYLVCVSYAWKIMSYTSIIYNTATL